MQSRFSYTNRCLATGMVGWINRFWLILWSGILLEMYWALKTILHGENLTMGQQHQWDPRSFKGNVVTVLRQCCYCGDLQEAYWKWIWSFKGPTKYILFIWFLLHATLPVGQSLKGNVATVLRQCCYCGDLQETNKHAP